MRRTTQRYIESYRASYQAVSALCWASAQSLVRCAVGQESDYRYLLAILTDVDCYGAGIDGIHPGINQFPSAFKAVKGTDPDLPTYREAMNGPH